MEDKERIEEALRILGLTANEWRDDPDEGITAVVGRFEVNTDAFEDRGVYVDDVGVVEACVVGAAKYHNQRVCFTFKADNMDAGMEIPGDGVLDLDAA